MHVHCIYLLNILPVFQHPLPPHYIKLQSAPEDISKMGQYDRKAQSQPKHGKTPDSGASKAPAAPPRRRPGWKGPSYIKKGLRQQPTPLQANAAPAPFALECLLPVKLQQIMLDVFRRGFPVSNNFEALKPTLREIKDALLQGDFGRADRGDKQLEAYAVRWSPSHALGFSNLLAWICEKNE